MDSISISISINGDNALRRKLDGFANATPQSIKRGLRKAGDIWFKLMRSRISGDGFTRNPGRTSPYPGVLTGQMFRTLFREVDPSGTTLRVGPNVNYAVHLEYGTRNMKARPFVGPTMQDKLDDAMDAFRDAIVEPLK